MITKDGRDTPLDKLTAENYIVPRGEEKDYHVVMELPSFDTRTGKRMSKPRLQKFGRKVYETIMEDALRKQGYTVNVLHNPTEWLRKQAEIVAANAKEAAAAKKAAEEARFKAAVAAEVARQIAAQKDGDGDEKKQPGRPPKQQKD